MNTEALVRRAAVLRAVRGFFDSDGFTEVETDVAIAAPAPEEHIDCPQLVSGAYLRASPELQMKKLLAAGMDRIYQIGPCFREGEKGDRHNPEFTMLEWYRLGATYADLKVDAERLLRIFAPDLAFSTVSVRDAYLEHAGWDPWAGEWNQDRFDYDMATVVEPALECIGGAVFLEDYPPQAASLAKVSPDGSGRLRAERWELYWDGLELANCFSELCDAEEQRRRFEKAREARKTLGESDYPLDFEFLDAISRIKSASGAALGIDRLVMKTTGVEKISAVRA